MLHGGKERERERERSKQGINSVQVNLNSGTTNLHQRLSQTPDERFESAKSVYHELNQTLLMCYYQIHPQQIHDT